MQSRERTVERLTQDFLQQFESDLKTDPYSTPPSTPPMQGYFLDRSPEEPIARIRATELHYAGSSKCNALMSELQEEQLRGAGFDPQDWIYYSNFRPKPNEDIDLQIKRELFKWNKYYPPGIRFLVIKGFYFGGVTRGHNSFGVTFPNYYPDDFSIFIGLEPLLLAEPQK